MNIPTLLRHALSTRLVRNVGKLMMGSGLGQLLTFAAMPIIARLFSPVSFGEQSALLGIVTPLTALASMAFPIAIVIAQSDDEALALSRLSVWSAFFVSSVATFVMLINDAWVLRQMGLVDIAPYGLLVPILVVLTTMNMSSSYLMTRYGAFGLSGWTAVTASAGGNFSKILLGLLHSGTLSLIFGNALGYIVGPLMALRIRAHAVARVRSLSGSLLLRIASRYREFPFYRAPQNFVATMAQAMPVIGLTMGFGPEVAGHYAMAAAIAGAPITLIGNSVQQVLYARLNETSLRGGDLSKLLLLATTALAAVGVPLVLIFGVYGKPIFKFLLGEMWIASGEIASILIFSLWLWLSARPAMASIPVAGLQSGLLKYELIATLAKIGAIGIGIHVFGTPMATVAMFSAVSAATWVILILWVRAHTRPTKRANKFPQNR